MKRCVITMCLEGILLIKCVAVRKAWPQYLRGIEVVARRASKAHHNDMPVFSFGRAVLLVGVGAGDKVWYQL
jgi:hypothetical protein